jgi:hypothetical protein
MTKLPTGNLSDSATERERLDRLFIVPPQVAMTEVQDLGHALLPHRSGLGSHF